MKQHNTPEEIHPFPRRMGFEFSDDIPKYWANGNPVLSAWSAAMSTVFPDGERFFIEAVRNYEADITDPELKKAIKGFIGQEAHHGKEHDTLNAFFESKGLPVSAAKEKVKNALQMGLDNMPKKSQLAMTVALEHFTAMMADVYLRTEEIRQAGDPRIEAVFYWHAIEETEHKAVAYDVYEAVKGGYWLRVLTMLSVTFGLLSQVFWIQCKYLVAWKELGNLRAWGGAINFLWGNPGWLRKTIPSYLRFFKPGFHPWQEDNRDLLENWQDDLGKYLNAESLHFKIQEQGAK